LGVGKYRGFPVEGDSMPPHQDGDIIVGRYVERLVLDGKTYILITRDEGMVYKRLNKKRKNALVASDNYFIRLMKSKLRIFLKFGNTNVVLQK
jgi:phage repressor protein C with HTH and peptisase S24 domain